MTGAGSASATIPCARPAGSAGQMQWPSNRLEPQLGPEPQRVWVLYIYALMGHGVIE